MFLKYRLYFFLVLYEIKIVVVRFFLILNNSFDFGCFVVDVEYVNNVSNNYDVRE